MSLVTFTCPYCSAENQMHINEVTVSDTFTIKAIAHGETVVSHIPIYDVKCRLCLNQYEPIKVSDYGYIKNNLTPKIDMLQTFKSMFPNQANGINAILNNIVAITRPKKSVADKIFGRKPRLHIFFVIDGIRAYVDCEQSTNKTKTILRGLDIGEI